MCDAVRAIQGDMRSQHAKKCAELKTPCDVDTLQAFPHVRLQVRTRRQQWLGIDIPTAMNVSCRRREAALLRHLGHDWNQALKSNRLDDVLGLDNLILMGHKDLVALGHLRECNRSGGRWSSSSCGRRGKWGGDGGQIRHKIEVTTRVEVGNTSDG